MTRIHSSRSRGRTLAGSVLAAAGLAAACSTPGATRHGPGYAYYVVGNAGDVDRPTRGLWVAQGGGDDVDQNYVRMGAYGGGGDFVVLRASGADDYNDYILRLCACDSVETIVFDKGAATADPFVVATIRNAEAVFIAGGDQSNYIRYWKDTPVEDAINHVAAKPAPVGGTSAGMAVMGEFVYSAEGNESLTSAVALADPYAADLTLARGFLHLPWLENVITDQHLQERDRIGRTVALISRLQQDGWSARPRAIAADRETAIHVDPATGTAEIFATADHPTPYVYFLEPSGPPASCERGRPLSTGAIAVYRAGPGARFDLKTWSGAGGIAYELGASDGVLHSSRGSNY
jgi:cyanophycinase-like exopeptidase